MTPASGLGFCTSCHGRQCPPPASPRPCVLSPRACVRGRCLTGENTRCGSRKRAPLGGSQGAPLKRAPPGDGALHFAQNRHMCSWAPGLRKAELQAPSLIHTFEIQRRRGRGRLFPGPLLSSEQAASSVGSASSSHALLRVGPGRGRGHVALHSLASDITPGSSSATYVHVLQLTMLLE